jgi:hypothetical protein
MKARSGGDDGYSLLELIVALALAIAALSIVAHLCVGLRETMLTAGERNDLQQRARVLVDAVGGALSRAGAGADSGEAKGPLVRFLPPVLPRGTSGVLVIAAAGTGPPARLASPLPAGGTWAALEFAPGCPAPCGFADGTVMLVFDTHGDFDVYTIRDSAGTAVTIERHAAGTGASYVAGAPVVLAAPQELRFDPASLELRASDGLAPSFAVVNGVVDLAFEYLGDAVPPTLPAGAEGQENCLYDAAGAPRPMPVLAGAVVTLAPLATGLFGDGPWCGTGPTPFDADLLRIRAVRVSARLQATNPALRGSDGRWFRVPGTLVDATLAVHDVRVNTTAAPANLVRAAVR